jgi:DNA-binding MarR family transcriptional regulator
MIVYINSQGTAMVDDIVRNLGYLMLGTRLKRLAETMQGQATRIAAAHGVAVQSSQYPFLSALDQFGPMTIGEMADAVGITQPGVTRAIAQLARMGMVKVRPGSDDRRQRIISLAAPGRRQIELGKEQVWPLVEAAVADLCDGLDGPLLDQLAAMENGLATRPLEQRINGGKR